MEKSGVGSSVRLVKYLQQNLFNNLLFLLAEMVLKVVTFNGKGINVQM